LPNIISLPPITIALILVVKKDGFVTTSVPTTTITATNTGLIFIASRNLLTLIANRATGYKIEGIMAFHSGLLTDPLSRMSSVSSASPSATQSLNALNFAAMNNSRLPILLLVMFLLLIL
jgi:hypothetical protein